MSRSQDGRGRDQRAGSHPAGAEDFESGLDYGAFSEEEPTAAQPTQTLPTGRGRGGASADHATTVLSADELSSLRGADAGSHTAEPIVASRPVPQAAPATAALPLEPDYPRDGFVAGAPTAASAPAGPSAEERARLPKAGPRVAQTLLALLAPFVLLLGAVRLVASPLFLWLEYHRPGFPADPFGFSTDDRLHFGSAGLDYLHNLAGTRYLSSLTQEGAPLFTDAEVAHMADVKAVMWGADVALVVLAVVCALLIAHLVRHSPGGVRRALFAAALWFLAALVVLAVFAVLGWSALFAGFHSLFFADGTWTFSVSDALIRLYPGQFWIDAAAAVGLLSLAAALATLAFTWPSRRRRERSADQRAALEATRLRWAREETAEVR